MNVKKIGSMTIILVGMFLLWWVVSTGSHLSNAEDTYEQLLLVSSSMQGYNYMKAQPLFAVVYMVTVNLLLPQVNVQYLIRKSRVRWLTKRIGLLGICAIWFAFLFVGVQMLAARVSLGSAFLSSYGYFQTMLIYGAVLACFYWFASGLYLLCYVVFMSSLKTLGVAFILHIVLMSMAFYRYIPTIYLCLDIIQLSIISIDIMLYAKQLIWNLIAMILLFIISAAIFQKRDLINHENETIS